MRSAISPWARAGQGRAAGGFEEDDMAVRVIRVTCHVDALIPTQRVFVGV